MEFADEFQGCCMGCPFLLLDKNSLGYLKIYYTMWELEHILMDGYTKSQFHYLLCHQDCVIDSLGASDPGTNLLMSLPPLQNGEDSGSSQAHWSTVQMDCFSMPIKLSEFRWERYSYYDPLKSTPSFVLKLKLYLISLVNCTLHIGHLPRTCKISHVN